MTNGKMRISCLVGSEEFLQIQIKNLCSMTETDKNSAAQWIEEQLRIRTSEIQFQVVYSDEIYKGQNGDTVTIQDKGMRHFFYSLMNRKENHVQLYFEGPVNRTFEEIVQFPPPEIEYSDDSEMSDVEFCDFLKRLERRQQAIMIPAAKPSKERSPSPEAARKVLAEQDFQPQLPAPVLTRVLPREESTVEKSFDADVFALKTAIQDLCNAIEELDPSLCTDSISKIDTINSQSKLSCPKPGVSVDRSLEDHPNLLHESMRSMMKKPPCALEATSPLPIPDTIKEDHCEGSSRSIVLTPPKSIQSTSNDQSWSLFEPASKLMGDLGYIPRLRQLTPFTAEWIDLKNEYEEEYAQGRVNMPFPRLVTVAKFFGYDDVEIGPLTDELKELLNAPLLPQGKETIEELQMMRDLAIRLKRFTARHPPIEGPLPSIREICVERSNRLFERYVVVINNYLQERHCDEILKALASYYMSVERQFYYDLKHAEYKPMGDSYRRIVAVYNELVESGMATPITDKFACDIERITKDYYSTPLHKRLAQGKAALGIEYSKCPKPKPTTKSPLSMTVATSTDVEAKKVSVPVETQTDQQLEKLVKHNVEEEMNRQIDQLRAVMKHLGVKGDDEKKKRKRKCSCQRPRRNKKRSADLTESGVREPLKKPTEKTYLDQLLDGDVPLEESSVQKTYLDQLLDGDVPLEGTPPHSQHVDAVWQQFKKSAFYKRFPDEMRRPEVGEEFVLHSTELLPIETMEKLNLVRLGGANYKVVKKLLHPQPEKLFRLNFGSTVSNGPCLSVTEESDFSLDWSGIYTKTIRFVNNAAHTVLRPRIEVRFAHNMKLESVNYNDMPALIGVAQHLDVKIELTHDDDQKDAVLVIQLVGPDESILSSQVAISLPNCRMFTPVPPENSYFDDAEEAEVQTDSCQYEEFLENNTLPMERNEEHDDSSDSDESKLSDAVDEEANLNDYAVFSDDDDTSTAMEPSDDESDFEVVC